MKTFKFSGHINLPVAQIDLYEWLTNITENEYKSFSKAHITIGLNIIDDVNSMVNVERIGGNLLIHHYKIDQKDKSQVVLNSRKSDAYLFHLIKVHVSVEWRMSVRSNEYNGSIFTCEITVNYPNKLLEIASKLVAGNYFLQNHINEEGPLFVKNIEARFKHY